MSGWSSRLRAAPFGALALLLVAAVLYVVLLANAFPPTDGGGEERISQAVGAVIFALCLWIVLALLLLVGGVRGEMPRWAAVSAVVLHPLAGVGEVVALDALSRHVSGAIVFVALLPLAIAGYAMWARLTELHQAYPPQSVSVAALSAIAALTMGGMACGL